MDIWTAGTLPTIPAVGNNITDFSLTAVYEELPNRAFFLGELTKFVHVSPMRFESVVCGGAGPSGITVVAYGGVEERLSLVSVDGHGVVHVKAVSVPVSGVVKAEL